MNRFAVLITLALLLGLTSAAHAKKGGGGKPGGDGGGMADADVTILYRAFETSSADPASIWKGDNAGNVELVTSVPGYWPSFGPTGTTTMVFASDMDGPGIYVAPDFSGSSAFKLVPTTELSWATPVWSNGPAPNGEEMIAYIDVDEETGILQLFATTLSGEVTQLTFDEGGPMTFSNLGYPITGDPSLPVSFGWQVKYHPSWNPVTNDEIVLRGQYVVAQPEGSYYVRGLWRIQLDGDPSTGALWVSETEDLTFGTTINDLAPLSPSFSADGASVVFVAHASQAVKHDEIWSYDLSTSGFTNLTNGAAQGPTLSPCVRKDGKIMFSDLKPRKGIVLFTMNANGSNLEVYGNAKGRNEHRQIHVAARR